MEVKQRKQGTLILKLINFVRQTRFLRIKRYYRRIMNKYRDLFIMMLITLMIVIILEIYFNYIAVVASPKKSIPLPSTTTTERQLIGSPIMHVRLNEIYKDNKAIIYDSKDYSFELEERQQGYPKMINTPGCKIPIALANYRKEIHRNKTADCGKRAVFIEKIDIDNVRVYIDKQKLRKHLVKSAHFYCCYEFSNMFEQVDINAQYHNRCNNLTNGLIIQLKSDFINVYCFELDISTNTTEIFYDDLYAFVKRNKGKTRITERNCTHNFNVMLIGISSMSLSRFVQTMPRTVHLFKENFWLGFRGYHKVDDPSYLNLMALFSGKAKPLPLICNLPQCKELIWNRFKESGFHTAFGEDINLPGYSIEFEKPPTDHFFKMHPNRFKEKYCAGQTWTTKHLLNFAFDFANTYKNNSFFGIFWSNIFAHGIDIRPHEVDIIYEDFLNRLSYTRVLENTFIIFFSDHGVRYGEQRLKVESYYDERMPILFMWAPKSFGGYYPTKLKYTAINQFKFVTPYDLYNTLVKINLLSKCINASQSVNFAPDCPKCQSLFTEINSSRHCKDVNIGESRCSCHNLYPLDVHDTEGMKTVSFVVSHMKSFIQSIKAKQCWTCATLFLDKIVRIHFYYSNDKTGLYYVVAFVMSPGNITFEATALKKDNKIELVDTVSAISTTEHLGTCVLNPQNQHYCFCQKKSEC